MKAKDYSTVEEFAMDPRFRRFVLNPDKRDLAYWDLYLKNYPEKILLIREAKELVNWLEQAKHISQSTVLSATDTDKLWNKIEQSSLAKDKSPTLQTKQSQPKSPNRWIYYSIAASLALLVTVFSYLLISGSSTTPEPVQSEQEWITNYNAPGIKSSIRLFDGSKVLLNSGSKIKYLSHFDKGIREIYLEGEAFFEVAKDSLRPFVVHTGEFTTQALGTSFNIKSFPDKKTKVTLASGVIRVEDLKNGQNKILNPGQGVQFSDSIGEIQEINLKQELAWTDKTLWFDQLEFQEVIEELSNWYGVHFTLNNVPEKLPTTTASYQDESLENILLGLSYKLDFTYKLREKEIEINFIKK